MYLLNYLLFSALHLKQINLTILHKAVELPDQKNFKFDLPDFKIVRITQLN